MARTGSNMVVAKEAIVINVGASPPVYPKIEVVDRRTQQLVTINGDVPTDEGDEGIPYAFKAGQKVSRNHEAVKACPGAFVTVEDAEEMELVDA